MNTRHRQLLSRHEKQSQTVKPREVLRPPFAKLISTEPKPRRALPQSHGRLSALGMPDLPEPLVGRHKAFLSAAVLHAPRGLGS